MSWNFTVESPCGFLSRVGGRQAPGVTHFGISRIYCEFGRAPGTVMDTGREVCGLASPLLWVMVWETDTLPGRRHGSPAGRHRVWLWWRWGTHRHLPVVLARVKPQLRTCRSVWEEPLLFPELVDFSTCCSSGTSERGLGTPAVTPISERMGL